MKRGFLFVVIAALASVVAHADVESAFGTIQEIRNGLNQGLYQSLSLEQKIKFEKTLTEARDLLQNTSSGLPTLVCAPAGNGNFIATDANTAKTYGLPVYPLTICEQTLPKAGSQLACFAAGNGNFQISNISTGQALGEPTYPLQNCQNLIAAPVQNFICAPAGNGNFQVTNILTGMKIGLPVYPLTTCLATLPQK